MASRRISTTFAASYKCWRRLTTRRPGSGLSEGLSIAWQKLWCFLVKSWRTLFHGSGLMSWASCFGDFARSAWHPKQPLNMVFKKRLDTRRIAMFQFQVPQNHSASGSDTCKELLPVLLLPLSNVLAAILWLWEFHSQQLLAAWINALYKPSTAVHHQMQRCSGNSRNWKVSESEGIWSQPLHRIMLVVLETQHDQSKDHQNFQRQLGRKVRTNLKVAPWSPHQGSFSTLQRKKLFECLLCLHMFTPCMLLEGFHSSWIP